MYEIDRAGNPMCGQSFMAGTLCSLAPGHLGAHAPICQTCGEDWYERPCACETKCLNCGSRVFDAAEDGHVYCEDCRCFTDDVHDAGKECFLEDGHDGPHQLHPGMPVTEEEIAAAIQSIEADMPALLIVFKTCVDCGQSIGSTLGGDPPTCKTHN